MAKITGQTNESVYSIPKWLGLNEHPDGDTRLKLGEASIMENWRITRDGNLKRRGGLRHVMGLRTLYSPKEDDDAVTLGTYPKSKRFNIYSAINCNDPFGTVSMSGTPEYVTAQTAAGYTNKKYIKMNEAVYAITQSDWTLQGNNYVLTAHRVRAKAYDSGFVADKPIAGLWYGPIASGNVMLAACDGMLYRINNPTSSSATRDLIGALNTTKGVHFFPFDGKVYILNGYEYYQLTYSNGSFSLATVEGYRPLVAIGISPYLGNGGAESGETTGEYINRLNGKRRVWVSPDGEGYQFKLPEKHTNLVVDYVITRPGGTAVSYTYNGSTGIVTFSGENPPPKGVNTYEIGYTMPTNYRAQVAGNLYSEIFSGTTDTRIFLYGDGTNRAIYSGMDYDGMPRADYFPDSYEVRVGDSNTKLTGMIRHYATLIAYKPHECWSLQHGIVELATDELTPAVYSQPVNREIGNAAMGQVRLVNNNPITLHRYDLYDWSNSSYYTSNLSRDERQAKRISDKVQKSIRDFTLANAVTWDDNDNQEYYVVYNDTALVWNYAANAWYKYTNFPASCLCSYAGHLFIGTTDGRVMRLADTVKTDDGDVVTAEWKSGAMDFGAAYARKYCPMMWIGLKPYMSTSGKNEYETSATVSVLTDRKDTFREKIAVSDKARVGGEPFTVKIKLKAKKFIFYHLLLSTDEAQYPVTVTDASFRVRQTGYAK